MLMSLPKENTTQPDRARLGNFLTPPTLRRARPLHWDVLPQARRWAAAGGWLSYLSVYRLSVFRVRGQVESTHPPVHHTSALFNML